MQSYTCGVHICISVLMNYDCKTHPMLPFITITKTFLSKQFHRKTFLRGVDPKCLMPCNLRDNNVLLHSTPASRQISYNKQPNFHFDLSLKLSQGEVHDFSEV